MEEKQLKFLIYVITAGVGATVITMFAWGPAARFMDRIQPDPEKRFKIVFLIGLALFVIVGVAMSIGIMLKLLGVV
ncbi:MAG: hypothetical protein ACNS63_05625 [Candidatus Nitrospinota bacterium M3_3B_026]